MWRLNTSNSSSAHSLVRLRNLAGLACAGPPSGGSEVSCENETVGIYFWNLYSSCEGETVNKKVKSSWANGEEDVKKIMKGMLWCCGECLGH